MKNILRSSTKESIMQKKTIFVPTESFVKRLTIAEKWKEKVSCVLIERVIIGENQWKSYHFAFINMQQSESLYSFALQDYFYCLNL